jgi:hypothetical protein
MYRGGKNMSVITHTIVADLSIAKELCENITLYRAYSKEEKCFVVETPGLTPGKLASLLATLSMLSNKQDNPAMLQKFPLLREKSTCWLYEVSDDLVSRLANVDPCSLEEISKHWFQYHEFQEEEWSADVVSNHLENLFEASTEATKSIRPVALHIML